MKIVKFGQQSVNPFLINEFSIFNDDLTFKLTLKLINRLINFRYILNIHLSIRARFPLLARYGPAVPFV